MKYAIILPLLFISFTFVHAQSPVFKRPTITLLLKKPYVNVSNASLKEIKSSPLPTGIQIRGNKLYPARGYIFLAKDQFHLVIPKADYDLIDRNGNGTIALNFEPVASSTHPGGGSFMVFCSCGENTIRISGDKCKVLLDEEEASLKCMGSCDSQNTGLDCSYTYWHF